MMTNLLSLEQVTEDKFWTVFDALKNGMHPDMALTRDSEHLFKKCTNSKAIISPKFNTDLSCPYCLSEDVILKDGDYVCELCDAFVCRNIDACAEWRCYQSEDGKKQDVARCGGPSSELFPESFDSCVIGYSTNKKHETYNERLMRKCHLWNCSSYKERSLHGNCEAIMLHAAPQGINVSIIEEAKMLYKKFSEQKKGRGDNRHALLASSLYMACKRAGVPRGPKEIAKMFNIKVTTLTKACKKFQEIMQMNTQSTSATDFIARFCSKLGLDSDFQAMCMKVAENVEKMDIASDNTPPSVAVSVMYFCSMACGVKIDKKEMSAKCDISQITINKCCNKLELYKKQLLGPEYKHLLSSHHDSV